MDVRPPHSVSLESSSIMDIDLTNSHAYIATTHAPEPPSSPTFTFDSVAALGLESRPGIESGLCIDSFYNIDSGVKAAKKSAKAKIGAKFSAKRDRARAGSGAENYTNNSNTANYRGASIFNGTKCSDSLDKPAKRRRASLHNNMIRYRNSVRSLLAGGSDKEQTGFHSEDRDGIDALAKEYNQYISAVHDWVSDNDYEVGAVVYVWHSPRMSPRFESQPCAGDEFSFRKNWPNLSPH